jgi:hypothetical protein
LSSALKLVVNGLEDAPEPAAPQDPHDAVAADFLRNRPVGRVRRRRALVSVPELGCIPKLRRLAHRSFLRRRRRLSTTGPFGPSRVPGGPEGLPRNLAWGTLGKFVKWTTTDWMLFRACPIMIPGILRSEQQVAGSAAPPTATVIHIDGFS